MANRRKKKKNPLSVVIAVLTGLLVMALLAFGLFRVLKSDRLLGYPVLYREEITQIARDNGLSPAYIAAVVMTESSYRPNVVSSVGARGLMQIMPETGEWIASKLGEEFTADDLFQPEVNLRYGGWYLAYLMNRYGGDMRCASAAYTAGLGNVDKWLQDPACSDDGKTLKKMGFSSTDTYVNRVLKYYDYYAKKYESDL